MSIASLQELAHSIDIVNQKKINTKVELIREIQKLHSAVLVFELHIKCHVMTLDSKVSGDQNVKKIAVWQR